jgi:hypothetical protein
MNQTIDISTAAKLLGMNAGHLRRLCIAGKYTGAARTSQGWQIPISADSRLSGVKSPGQLSLETDLTDVPKHKRDEAIRRRGIIEQAEQFCGHAVRNNICRISAMQRFSTDTGIPVRTLQRWMSSFRERGIAGLIDSRGGQSLGDVITPEAWSEFLSMYLTPQRLSVKTCLNNILYVAKTHKKNWTIPSLRTIQQYVNDKIPVPVLVLHREGQTAYDAKCAPYLMVDQNSVNPGQVWVGDHHQFDCWIRHRGDWLRPWITAWEDYRSRKIVGWHISTAPNSTTILRAMRHGIDLVGPPESVKIDNGKDYDSQTFTGQTKAQRRKSIISDDECKIVRGLYALMGIAVSFAIPYNARAKKIERWFATLADQFTKTIPTYCGPDTGRRPEDLFDYMKTDKAIAEALTLETFTAAAERYIANYNASVHTGEGMDGQTPDAVFASRTSRRVIDTSTLDLMARVWSPPLTVGKNGVKFKGFYYGQYNNDLMNRFGRQVLLGYDPDDIGTMDVFDDVTYKYITTVQQAQLMAYGKVSDEDLRDAMAKRSRSVRLVKQARPAARVAAMNLTDLVLESKADRLQADDIQAPGVSAGMVCNVKPVKTPLDGQAKEYLKQRNRQQIRKAAGAETMTTAPRLDFDPVETQNFASPSLDFTMDEKPSRKGIRLSYD